MGWSFLEGIGAALIMPAVVALVASNFERAERPRAYGLVAAAGAIAVAAGPLIGGLFTTYWSWRYVFVGEVLIAGVILLMARRMADTEPEQAKLDLVGTLLVCHWARAHRVRHPAGRYVGVRRTRNPARQSGWASHRSSGWSSREASSCWSSSHGSGDGSPPATPPWSTRPCCRIRQLRGGLTAFFFQYLLQAGLFFTIPLFLSVALGLSAIETGVRVLPLSITLLIAAIGVPRVFPDASPRRVARFGFVMLFAGIVVLVAALDAGAGPEIVTWPMLLAGLGIGALASQLGSVTVSSVPDEQSGEVGGLQNTVTNLGASIGTALAGAVLISVLTTSLLTGIQSNPDVPEDLSSQAQVELAGGVPFISDADLEKSLEDAGVHGETAQSHRRRKRQRPHRRLAQRPRRPRRHRPVRLVLRTLHPDDTTWGRSTRKQEANPPRAYKLTLRSPETPRSADCHCALHGSSSSAIARACRLKRCSPRKVNRTRRVARTSCFAAVRPPRGVPVGPNGSLRIRSHYYLAVGKRGVLAAVWFSARLARGAIRDTMVATTVTR